MVILKTIYGKMVAAYSEECFNSGATKKGNAFLMALWSQQMYDITSGARSITYDDYYIIFGNSELRIKSLETKVFSNFGVRNGYFESRGDKI